jgi:hypothetical protein
MANCKSDGSEGCIDRWDAMVGPIGIVSHHLRSLLGAIELRVLYAFVSKI